MSTPTGHPKNHGSSQQGRPQSQSQYQSKTPASQSSQHAATPPVSTPFQSAFSPLAVRSSPQQVKKSPAATAASMSGPSVPSLGLNFDSPGVLGALQQAGLDLHVGGLAGGGLGPLPKNADDEFGKRLDDVIANLSRHKGLVSENGLERLAKRVGLECMWEPGKTAECKRNLVVAGLALELQVGFRESTVQSVELSFPDSADMVTKHAGRAAQILLNDLKLAPGQITLTKSMAPFAANFERLAALDKLSVNGLNLYEAVAGVYESLLRLYQKEVRDHQEHPENAGKPDALAEKAALCAGSGRPVMNAHGRVGVTLEYWVEKHLSTLRASETGKRGRIWALIVGCSALPLEHNIVLPVRISDKWTDPDLNKPRLPGDTSLDRQAHWLEPDRTYIQSSPEDSMGKAGAHGALPDLMTEPRLPEVGFLATFDPPICLPMGMIEQLRGIGCAFPSSQLDLMDANLNTLESLLVPALSVSLWDRGLIKTTTKTKQVHAVMPSSRHPKHDAAKAKDDELEAERTHINTLVVNKSTPGKRVTDMLFSHPRQLCELLPYLRVYGFFAVLLQKSFGEEQGGGDEDDEDEDRGKGGPSQSLYTVAPRKRYDKDKGKGKDGGASKNGSTSAGQHPRPKPRPKIIATTNDPNFRPFGNKAQQARPLSPPPEDEQSGPGCRIDMTILEIVPPRLQVVFPFGEGGEAGRRRVVLEIRENARVHVVAQDVIVEGVNDEVPDGSGRKRRPEMIGEILEKLEDLNEMCEFMRARWA